MARPGDLAMHAVRRCLYWTAGTMILFGPPAAVVAQRNAKALDYDGGDGGTAARLELPAYRRPVTLDARNERLEVVLQAIDRQADLGLVYDPERVPLDRRVTVHVHGIEASEVLAMALEGTGLRARITGDGQTLLEKGTPTAYDGRFAFVRLRYVPLPAPAGCRESDGPAGKGWGHDHPDAAQGMMKAATELTSLDAPVDTTPVMAVDDPELMKYPLAYVSEPGCWHPTDVEVKSLRAYLLKGGFLIVDDLTFSDNTPEHCDLARVRFEQWMARVLPKGRVVPIHSADPIFNGLFKIDPLQMPNCAYAEGGGEIYGIYEQNDPKRRLMVVVNYTKSLGHRWRWAGGMGSGLGENSIAYKLGLNYLIYGLSH